jgi:hypothetical protein
MPVWKWKSNPEWCTYRTKLHIRITCTYCIKLHQLAEKNCTQNGNLAIPSSGRYELLSLPALPAHRPRPRSRARPRFQSEPFRPIRSYRELPGPTGTYRDLKNVKTITSLHRTNSSYSDLLGSASSIRVYSCPFVVWFIPPENTVKPPAIPPVIEAEPEL